MEFIKLGKKYLIKNSNGRIVDEKTKLELENKELVLKDITGCECQKETTKKISKNKKRIKELEQEEPFIVDVAKKYEYLKDNEEYNKRKEPIKIETALQDKENADGIVKKAVSTD